MNIPEGWKLVPVELTAENGMKAALIGEFSISIPLWDEDGNEYLRPVNVPWDTIKKIHRAIIAASPTPPAQSNQWKEAVLLQCMAIEGCYNENNPIETMNCLIDWHVKNETTLAQEDEPVYQTYLRAGQWADCSEENYHYYREGGVIETRVLYTHVPSDNLSKAAEELLAHLYDAPNGQPPRKYVENLRAALEGK